MNLCGPSDDGTFLIKLSINYNIIIHVWGVGGTEDGNLLLASENGMVWQWGGGWGVGHSQIYILERCLMRIADERKDDKQGGVNYQICRVG